MRTFLFKIWSKFLAWFGNIRISKYFPWLYYDTTDFKVTGEKILEIANIIKPGDVILRGYDSYLDSKFIPSKLRFSHGAIYVGNNKIIHAIAKGVSEISLIDFCQCDRIAIFRPNKYQKSAIATAKKFLKNKVPYDFGFKYSISSLYCFELCAFCYPKLKINQKTVKKFFGLFKKQIYIADSFFETPDMKCIFHFNPKFCIDSVRQMSLDIFDKS